MAGGGVGGAVATTADHLGTNYIIWGFGRALIEIHTGDPIGGAAGGGVGDAVTATADHLGTEPTTTTTWAKREGDMSLFICFMPWGEPTRIRSGRTAGLQEGEEEEEERGEGMEHGVSCNWPFLTVLL